MNYFTHYWQNETWEHNRIITPKGELLPHLAGNMFEPRGVRPGDTVYVVTVKEGKLFLCAKIIVERFTDVNEIAGILGMPVDEVWQADQHIVASKSTPVNWNLEVSVETTRQLEFLSNGLTSKLIFQSKDRLDQQTLRGVRRLTPESAAQLDKLLPALQPIKVRKFAKNYWWVNHKQTNKEELSGGYIWSPKKNKNGATNQTYLNLTRAQLNDIVFSYADGEIKAVGVVSKTYQNYDRPLAFGHVGNQWDQDGWLVKIDWTFLEDSFSPKTFIDEIAPLLPVVNSPIQQNGNGNQGCYLASISNDLGELLINLSKVDKTEIEEIQHDVNESIAEDEEEENIQQQVISVVEKEQLVKARRGQGIFRANLELTEKGCRLTGVKDKRFLIASHIKPWKDSSNEEKLDGHNGLLLSPHVDKLFDKGWISFTDTGEILCANDEVKELMKVWGLDYSIYVGEFKQKQKEYLKYHRENILKSQ